MIGSNAGANKISGFDMCFGFCFAHGGILAEAIDDISTAAPGV